VDVFKLIDFANVVRRPIAKYAVGNAGAPVSGGFSLVASY